MEKYGIQDALGNKADSGGAGRSSNQDISLLVPKISR
jgi:hypothetical protein